MKSRHGSLTLLFLCTLLILTFTSAQESSQNSEQAANNLLEKFTNKRLLATSCPIGKYKSGSRCYSCNYKCRTCTTSSTRCTSCYSGYVFSVNSCYECGSMCSTCANNNVNYCYTCWDGYYVKNGQCFYGIDPATYQEYQSTSGGDGSSSSGSSPYVAPPSSVASTNYSSTSADTSKSLSTIFTVIGAVLFAIIMLVFIIKKRMAVKAQQAKAAATEAYLKTAGVQSPSIHLTPEVATATGPAPSMNGPPSFKAGGAYLPPPPVFTSTAQPKSFTNNGYVVSQPPPMTSLNSNETFSAGTRAPLALPPGFVDSNYAFSMPMQAQRPFPYQPPTPLPLVVSGGSKGLFLPPGFS